MLGVPGTVVLYAAVSLDGFIATEDGGVAWLDQFNTRDYGFADFMGSVGSALMGRATFEQSLGFGDWPYGKTPILVLTHRPLADAPASARPVTPPLRPEVERLLAEQPGDLWVVGGGQTVRQCLAEGLIDKFWLFVMPVALGTGLPLFPDGFPETGLRLHQHRAHPNGVVEAVYLRD